MNMFTRKAKPTTSQVDEINRKKTATKVLDIKKDLKDRLRHLKSYIETTQDTQELKQFFEQHYTQIYYIFYESFVNVESSIKQKLSKPVQQDLNDVLFIFLKILLLQPEKLHGRWQVRSIGRIILKLIHVGNTKTIKFYGIRLFLIWYQILNTNKTHVEEIMFQKLIQGFDTFHSYAQLGGATIDLLSAEAHKVFNNDNSVQSSVGTGLGKSICPFEINPIIPVQPNDIGHFQPQTQMPHAQSQGSASSQIPLSGQGHHYHRDSHRDSHHGHHQGQSGGAQGLGQGGSGAAISGVFNLTAEMLEKVLECMQQDCMLIEWSGDKQHQGQRCYEFLYNEFKRFYLSYMFPNAFMLNSVRNYSTSSTASSSTSSTQTLNSANFSTQHNLSLNVYSNIDLIQLLSEQPLPQFDRPILASIGNMTANDERKLAQLHCKEEIIKWLIGVLLVDTLPISPQGNKNLLNGTSNSTLTSSSGIGSSIHSTLDHFSSSNSSSTIGNLIPSFNENSNHSTNLNDNNTLTNNDNRTNNETSSDYSSVLNDFDTGSSSYGDGNNSQISSPSIMSSSIMSINTSNTTSISTSILTSSIHQLNSNKHLLQKVILGSITNVNLVHEILRNAFFLNFENYTTVQQVLNAYKKWFLKETRMPYFMQESTNNHKDMEPDYISSVTSSLINSDNEGEKGEFIENTFQRTNTESDTRIGYMRCLQIFFFHSSNLLLNRNNFQRDKIKNICCYTLEIYKLFIRKIPMDSPTWTLLITILLKVSEFLFNSEYLSNNRHEPATSQLIKLMTETVLLGIVKASFSYTVSTDLWNQLMRLLSSVSSNSDVIDKWIEVIDDLIRQVFKTSYQIDINNMPTIESKLDKKRKLKKTSVYNSNKDAGIVGPSTLNTSGVSGSGHNYHAPVTVSASNISQGNSNQHVTKPRARTEIYSPSSFSSIHSAITTNTATTPTMSPSPTSRSTSKNIPKSVVGHDSPNAISQPVSISGSTSLSNHNNNRSVSPNSGSVSPNLSGQSSNSEKTVSSSVPPLLSRQPSIKIQNTFRDDTYLHTLGNVTCSDIESTKSPSLNEERFAAINNNENRNNNNNNNATLKHISDKNDTPVITTTKSLSSSPRILPDSQNNSQNSSNIDDIDEEYNSSRGDTGADDEGADTSAVFEDDDISGDKSATLKANTQLDTITVNTQYGLQGQEKQEQKLDNQKINRFNSDKSIYYSSEVLAESGSNNTSHNASLNWNNNENSNSTNHDSSNTSNNSSQLNNSISMTFSPSSTQNTSTSLPPVLPPLPTSLPISNNHNSLNLQKNTSPNQPSQCPPPLPPLPPALASKYALKTALYLECVEPMSSSLPPAKTENNNWDQSELSDLRTERGIKCQSTFSDSEVFLKDNQIDTPSEAASMSGNDLSGEIFASPTSNNHNQDHYNASKLNNDMIQVSNILEGAGGGGGAPNSLLMPSSNQLDESSPTNNSALNTPQTFESNSNSPDGASLGLLGSMGVDKNEERSASFINNENNGSGGSSKHTKESLTRSSTLTAGMTLDNHEPNSNRGTITRQQTVSSMLPYGSHTTSIEESKNNYESVFKETANCLIKRLFGCLGNINAIKDPFIHKRVFEFIYNKWDKLNRIKETLKLTDLSLVIPSITYFSPWLFEAIYQLSSNYQSGKLIAYKTLCKIVIRSAVNGGMWQHVNEFDAINDEFMNLFYMTIHLGLNSEDKNIVNCIIQNCGPKFWHCMLPSCTLLLKDFIDACGSIDKEGPKYEAASILGSLISFPDYFGDMQVLSKPSPQPLGSLQNLSENSKEGSSGSDREDTSLHVENCTKEELKNLIIHNLTHFEDDISNTNSRVVIICTLTCFIYDEILNQRWHPRLNDAIKRLFKDLDFREQFNPVLVKMSCDNLKFLSILAIQIFQYEIQYAINIINMLNQCLVKLINSKPVIISEDYEKAIISNMFALLEWCMSMPLEKLKENDRGTLLRNNFKLIIHICNTFKPSESSESEHVHLAAKFIIQHLLTQLNHFPFGSTGPTKIVSSVNETSDLGLSLDELTPVLFEQPNIQFFTVNNQFLISFIELPMKGNEQFFDINPDLKTSSTVCRFIVRDFCGKNCWDCCVLQSPDQNLPTSFTLDIPFKNIQVATPDLDETSSNEDFKGEENEEEKVDEEISIADSNNNFDYTKLPFLSLEEIPKDIDILENILQYLSFSSPECRLEPDKSLNIVWDLNTHMNNLLNVEEVKNKLLDQSKMEKKHTDAQHEAEMLQLKLKQKNFYTLDQPDKDEQLKQESFESSSSTETTTRVHSYFHLCKSFVHQMGLLSWEKRQSFNLLRKTPQLLRELKSLDDQTCRETHKIALIYIAEGQEDKMSILSNESGSADYEYFLTKLAWTIDLETHEGFMGGLQHNYQLKTAPYYANSCCEVLFHVSTQMNHQNDPNKISKWRHLGNDSVQIIWSENTKDYERHILATEFADVIICIYPLRNELYRIKITKKQSVGYFGPLFDGAIINKQALPCLIRTTAINASRILLSNTKGYQDFFVHRAHAINNIIKTLTDKQTFENFIGDIYSPAIIPNSNGGNSQISTATGLPVPTLNLPTAAGSTTPINPNQDNSYNF